MKEEEIRIAYEAESQSLPQSPVRRFLAMKSARSSSGSLTGEFIFRSKPGSYGDDFAHISIPLDKKWEIDRAHIRIDGQLGEGAFGRVLKATAIGVSGLPPKHTVAIKTLKGNLLFLYSRNTPKFCAPKTNGWDQCVGKRSSIIRLSAFLTGLKLIRCYLVFR